MHRIFKISLFIIAVATLFSACSSKKNTWLSRNYHNTTAYFNIYWNGLETYKELLEDIDDLGYDNYNHVLNVYEYGSILDTAKTNVKTIRMIEKGTKAAQKHSMRIRGVEYVKTMEDAYMLMGIGYFYQHNYSMARTVFNFVSSQFPKSPIRYESLLWSARTYIQEQEYDMASSLILQVRNQENELYKQTYRELPAVTADFFISQSKYDEALPFLQEAIVRSNAKDFRNRLEFILGQIYQEEGQLKEAYDAYYYVTRHNPKMELDYNARLNMALCYDGAYANREKLIDELKKMLLDTKNERFFGRIYFVLAEIALHDHQVQDGMGYLKKSVEYSGASYDQLIISATRLADLYFEERDYATAQKYYKNAVNVMTPEHSDYDRVNTRAENLTELVKYLDIVKYEEQMQYLAGLPENKRNEAIDKIIEDYKNKQEEDAANTPKMKALAQPGSQMAGSTWYFYNEQAKTFGASEFVRKWGRRDNEDFWFLNQKPAFAMNRASEPEETENVEEEEQKKSGNYTPADREYYLVNMPVKSAAKERSNKRLEENEFLLGAGYFDLVEEPKLGIKTLEDLLVKFPNTGYKLQVYYYLYRMHMVLNNEAGKQTYKALLLSEFPDSEPTRQITDPNYYKTAQDNTFRAELLYQYTFEAYEGGYYDAVIDNVKDVEKRYPGNALMPRFKYLETMAQGSKEGVDATIRNLEQYIKTYPHEKDLADLAKSTITYLQESQPGSAVDSMEAKEQTVKQEEPKEEPKEPEQDVSMYVVNPGAPHYCLVFLNIPEVNPEVMQIRLSDFNRRSYTQDNLKISAEKWDEDYFLNYIYTFNTVSVAKGYLEELENSKYVFGSVPKEFYQIMLISAENFITFMKLRNREAYQYFFEKNY